MEQLGSQSKYRCSMVSGPGCCVVVGIHCVHYIVQKDCTAGLDAGVYERFPLQNLIRYTPAILRPDCTVYNVHETERTTLSLLQGLAHLANFCGACEGDLVHQVVFSQQLTHGSTARHHIEHACASQVRMQAEQRANSTTFRNILYFNFASLLACC